VILINCAHFVKDKRLIYSLQTNGLYKLIAKAIIASLNLP